MGVDGCWVLVGGLCGGRFGAGDTGFKVSMGSIPVMHKLLSQQLASPNVAKKFPSTPQEMQERMRYGGTTSLTTHCVGIRQLAK